MAKHGKHHQEAIKAVDRDRNYTPDEALDLAKETARAKFDETLEIHLRTGSDPRHADQLIRGVALLPHGLGKEVRVLVFAAGEAATAARQAGADHVGDDDIIQRIEGGWLEFDVAIATPDMMGKIGRLGRVLGRRGLMPNPRAGTVVQAQDFGRAVQEAKQGRIEFRLDRSGIIHAPLGKISFEKQMLMENMNSLVDTVVRARPSAVKGQFIRTAYLTTTMGPSIRLDVSRLLAMNN
ncbi:MAG: 50S ribosomal protein L1 [Chloroflexota bacterium]|nr:50S ribosomal protein L1 [Chloroflexota bacterium]MDE2941471.1 50S ribosomal protein L1 [Chloroflexota bacterium]MDE3268105.1 50S ribosomal protein L1 [Chloroflexota bacterium]